MEIRIKYKTEDSKRKALEYVIRNCMIWEGLEVTLCHVDADNYWGKLTLVVAGSEADVVDINISEYKITFFNGSTIQVRRIHYQQ